MTSKNTSEKNKKTGDKSNPEKEKPTEHGGPRGPEPTRYGDWERKGIVSDF